MKANLIPAYCCMYLNICGIIVEFYMYKYESRIVPLVSETCYEKNSRTVVCQNRVKK